MITLDLVPAHASEKPRYLWPVIEKHKASLLLRLPMEARKCTGGLTDRTPLSLPNEITRLFLRKGQVSHTL